MNLKETDAHYKKLKESASEQIGWVGVSPSSWYAWVAKRSGYDLSPNTLPKTVDRLTIKSMVKDPMVDIQSCCVATLAWGGMNRLHGASLMATAQAWLGLAEEIRNGDHSRREAYDLFRELRKRKLLQGMGPAYFTKLIFFLSPETENAGLIMDQWTSASVNLLSGQEIVKMHRSKIKQKTVERVFETVADTNTADNYERYCQFVEMLSGQDKLNLPPHRVEEILFSSGRGAGSWRQYVVENR